MNRRANKLLLLWSSLATLALLVCAAYRRIFARDWRRVQREYAAPLPAEQARGFPVQLRQVVRAGTARRRPLRLLPRRHGARARRRSTRHALCPRAPDGRATIRPSIGCTVCHGGQGRATEKADAHGDVPFWPRADDSAALRLCRLRQLPHASARAESRRRSTAAARWSSATTAWPATRLDGRGGTLRPGAAHGDGRRPISRASAAPAIDADWYEKHLRAARRAATDGPWKDSFGADRRGGPRGDRRVPRLARRRAGARRGQGAVPLARLPRLPQGRRRRRRRRAGPDARRREGPGAHSTSRTCPASKTLANWLAEHFRAPGDGRARLADAGAGSERRADRSAHVLHAVAAAQRLSRGVLAEGPHPRRALRRARVRHRRRDALRHLLRRLSRAAAAKACAIRA